MKDIFHLGENSQASIGCRLNSPMFKSLPKIPGGFFPGENRYRLELVAQHLWVVDLIVMQFCRHDEECACLYIITW